MPIAVLTDDAAAGWGHGKASILEREKELLASAEKRASEEVALLSDRSHRLQVSCHIIAPRSVWKLFSGISFPMIVVQSLIRVLCLRHRWTLSTVLKRRERCFLSLSLSLLGRILFVQF